MTLAQTLGELVCPPSGAPGTAAGDLAHLPCSDAPPVVGIPVIGTPAPVVTATYLNFGGVLTTTNGNWTNSPTGFIYQWQRNGINIALANANDYTLAAADDGQNIRCQIIATNAAGNSVPANSNAVGPVATAPPVNSGAKPSISPATAWLGTVLTVADGGWTGNPAPTFTHQWQRAGVNIPGQIGLAYTVVNADHGQVIQCVVTAHNVNTTEVAVATAGVTPFTGAPTKSVDPVVSPATGVHVGDTVSTTDGIWAGAQTITYRWLRDATDITGTLGAGKNYIAVAADETHLLRCRVIATNPNGSTSFLTNQTNAVLPVSMSLIIPDLIQVYPMQIDSPAGYTVVVPPFIPVGDKTSGGDSSPNFYEIPTNTIYDMRNMLGRMHDKSTQDYEYTMVNIGDCGTNAVLTGLMVHTTDAEWLAGTWGKIHGNKRFGDNAPAIKIGQGSPSYNTNGIRLEGIYVEHGMDSLMAFDNNWKVINGHFLSRDDGNQNDWGSYGYNYNCFFEGFVFLSIRGSGNDKYAIVTYENCIILQKRQPYDGDEKAYNNQAGGDYGNSGSWTPNPYVYDNANRYDLLTSSQAHSHSMPWLSHKSCFKAGASDHGDYPLISSIRVNMKNCLIGYEGTANEGPNLTFFPEIGDGSIATGSPHTGSKYTNVTVCVMAKGGWNGISKLQSAARLGEMGITVINTDGTQEKLANDTFQANLAAWKSQNGWNGTNYQWNRK